MKSKLRSYFRYWVLLVVVLVNLGVNLAKWSTVDPETGELVWHSLFGWAGSLAYAPMYVSLAMALALYIRSVVNRETTEMESINGEFVTWWKDLDPKTKVILTVIQLLIYLVCASLIISSLLH